MTCVPLGLTLVCSPRWLPLRVLWCCGDCQEEGATSETPETVFFSRSELLLREPSSLLPHGRLGAPLRDIFSDAFGEELRALALQSVLPLCMS